MQKLVRIGLVGFLTVTGTAMAAVTIPRALAPASGGMWEVSRSASGHNPTRICVATPDMLAQFEHRQRSCTRKVLTDQGTETLISYNCPAGGFGQSKMTLITPRSLKIETQGISDNLPFHYQLYARRVGDCAAR
ncbi:DUF3617 family protein [Sphingomonas sp. NSE70-1]|uniref:DUF3617 family protein n=1 Tax=Sphingomonas caseinilyticus TaxID=2908205 RepID=A0ABT0RSE3_9SPHN|nr:DUF3617 family protein [Sphingomonas caseinilyticus]